MRVNVYSQELAAAGQLITYGALAASSLEVVTFTRGRAHVEWWGRCDFEHPREMMTLLLLRRFLSLPTNARVLFRS